MSIKDEIGSVFGRLTVTGAAPSESGKAAWLCKCSCGGVHITTGDALRSGKTKSCGCYRDSGDFIRKHGHGSYIRGVSPTYKSWQEMRARCSNPTHISYPNYGGRGITFDASWNRFERFLSDMGPRPEGLSLDRRNNDKGYSRDNCKWSDRFEQNSNRRNVHQIEYLGRTQSLAVWCRELNVPYARTYARYISKDEEFAAAIGPKRKPGIQT